MIYNCQQHFLLNEQKILTKTVIKLAQSQKQHENN